MVGPVWLDLELASRETTDLYHLCLERKCWIGLTLGPFVVALSWLFLSLPVIVSFLLLLFLFILFIFGPLLGPRRLLSF